MQRAELEVPMLGFFLEGLLLLRDIGLLSLVQPLSPIPGVWVLGFRAWGIYGDAF